MDGYGGGGSIQQSSRLQDLSSFAPNPTGSAVFDASQYDFFGKGGVEEVELGGLDDEEDDLAPVGYGGEDLQLEKEEEYVDRSLPGMDDLTSAFSKMNKVSSGITDSGGSRDWGSFESSSATDWAKEVDFTNWYDKHGFDAETAHENKKWASQPYPSAPYVDSRSLHRTSSYPEQQHPHPHPQQNQQNQYSSEPILIPKSSFTSYPPPGVRSPQASPNGPAVHPNLPYHLQMPNSSPNNSTSPNLQLMNALPHGSQFRGHMPQFPHRTQNQWANQSDRPRFPINMMTPQQSPHQNGLMPQHLMSQQTRMQHPQFFNPHLSRSPPMMNNYEMLGDMRDQRGMRNRQGMRYPPHQGSDFHMQRGGNGWPRFTSKYMSADELEHIVRVQHAATHSNDPYVEDYYHQAILSRKSTGSKLKHHFCPTNLIDNPSKPRTSNETPFLQIDGLGRVNFSSIRRPRPLLEVDSSSSNNDTSESKNFQKPLEQEPMLAARVAIEDGICLLLDIDDIDRFLQFNPVPDGGAQLRQRRQSLLEGLASSFQLIDPLGKDGRTVDISEKDDFVFLRLVSLPKGKKLLLRYLQLLYPGELTRVVCMGIFRHLRFLFGTLPVDPTTTIKLATAVSSCVSNMDLKALAGCLASVVCSIEHPPLRPIGSPGDGASLLLKTVLEKATEILKERHESCSTTNRTFWQASFDAFFGLLMKYCVSKYDSIVQSFMMQQGSHDGLAGAITSEMPVELLRACLPHTNEQQKKVLIEFAQRSMPVQS